MIKNIFFWKRRYVIIILSKDYKTVLGIFWYLVYGIYG